MSIASMINIQERQNDNYKEEEGKNDNYHMTGGYSISELFHTDKSGESQTGGGIFNDLQIPLGVYYNNNILNNYYEKIKSKVIDDSLFDNLFNAVTKNKPKQTKRNIIPIVNKVTRKQTNKQ